MKLKRYGLIHSDGQKEKGWTFWCPACRSMHSYRTTAPTGLRSDGTPWPKWQFNKNMEKPSFTPSLRYSTQAGKLVDGKWVRRGPERTICHLYVTDGEIRYCGDNPHALNGKTVPLPDLPE